MAVTSGWSLTSTAFDKLLATLGPNRDAAGSEYEQMRRRLVRFFDGRGCPFPEDYADETLNRIARKLADGASIRDVPSYAVGIARLVVKEAMKEAQRRQALAAQPDHAIGEDREDAIRFDCMDGCLMRLTDEDRRLILDYYHASDDRITHRKQLSDRLHIPINALRIRAFRLRQQLERCVTQCMDGNAPGTFVRPVGEPRP